MRGLDNTCTVPCVSRNESSAAKLLVWNAKLNREPGAVAGTANARLVTAVRAEFPAVVDKVFDCAAEDKVVPGPTTPVATRLVVLPLNDANEAQFMPVW